MRIENSFNDNVTVDITVPPQQIDSGCQYFRVQKQKGFQLDTDTSLGKQGFYRLPPADTGDNFGQFSDLRVTVEVTTPTEEEFQDLNTDVIECRPEVNVSEGQAEELVLRVRPGQRFGEQVIDFFTSWGIPDEPFDLFQDVCTDTERNTAENPGDLSCSDRDTSSVDISLAVLAAVGTVLM